MPQIRLAAPTNLAGRASSLAVGLLKRMTTSAMNLACVMSGEAIPPEDVLAHCHRLKVVRIHTASIAAEMVERQAVRDRTALLLIGDAMGDRRSAITHYVSISLASDCTNPEMASRIRLRFALRQEPLGERIPRHTPPHAALTGRCASSRSMRRSTPFTAASVSPATSMRLILSGPSRISSGDISAITPI